MIPVVIQRDLENAETRGLVLILDDLRWAEQALLCSCTVSVSKAALVPGWN